MRTITFQKIEKELLGINTRLGVIVLSTFVEDTPTLSQEQHDELNRISTRVTDLLAEVAVANGPHSILRALAAKAAIAAKKKGRG